MNVDSNRVFSSADRVGAATDLPKCLHSSGKPPPGAVDVGWAPGNRWVPRDPRWRLSATTWSAAAEMRRDHRRRRFRLRSALPLRLAHHRPLRRQQPGRRLLLVGTRPIWPIPVFIYLNYFEFKQKQTNNTRNLFGCN